MLLDQSAYHIFIKTGFECPYLLQLLIVLRDLSAVFPDQFFIDTALIDTR